MKRLKKLNLRMPGWLLAIIPALSLVSCAHSRGYLEPTLGPDQVAILETRLPIWIVSIDGCKVPSLSLHDSASVKLLSGPHRVKVVLQQFGMGHVIEHRALKLQYSRTYGEGPLELPVEAKAGCKYFINYKVEDGSSATEKIWKVWIAQLDSI